MRGIAKLLFGGDGGRDGDGDRLPGLPGLPGADEDWFRLAGQARRAGEWCGTTPGRGAAADAVRGAPRRGRNPRPVSAPDFRSR